jgi:hypothetical protein
MMKLITRQTQANIAAKRFSDVGEPYLTKRSEEIKKLNELGENPNPDNVDEIIGNKSFTSTRCDECFENGVDVVEVGEDPDYESCTAHICMSCLAKALNIKSHPS